MMPKDNVGTKRQTWWAGLFPWRGGEEGRLLSSGLAPVGWDGEDGCKQCHPCSSAGRESNREKQLLLGGRDQGPSTNCPSAWVWTNNPSSTALFICTCHTLVHKVRSSYSKAELWPRGMCSPDLREPSALRGLGVKSWVQKWEGHWFRSSDLCEAQLSSAGAGCGTGRRNHLPGVASGVSLLTCKNGESTVFPLRRAGAVCAGAWSTGNT